MNKLLVRGDGDRRPGMCGLMGQDRGLNPFGVVVSVMLRKLQIIGLANNTIGSFLPLPFS